MPDWVLFAKIYHAYYIKILQFGNNCILAND